MTNKKLIENSNGMERKNNLIKIIIKLLLNFNKIPKSSGFTILVGIFIIFGLIICGVSASDEGLELIP